MAALSPEYLELLAKTIADIYGDATSTMIRVVSRRLARGIDADGWAEAKLLELVDLRNDTQAVVAQLQGAMPDAVTDAIADAAQTGVRAAVSELQITAPLSTATNTRAVDALARQTIGDLERSHLQIFRQVTDVYQRVVQQVGAPGVVTGAETRRQAAQRVLDQFAHRGITGFTSQRRDGTVARWGLDTYAEMTVRTSAGRAMVQGSLDQYEAEGRNFVIVSDAPQECDVCRRFEGQGLSIDGTGIGTTVGGIRIIDSVRGATSKGLWHPNCRHRATPIVPGLTRRMTHTSDPEGDALRREQRRLERGVREWKRVEAAALDDVAAARARAKVREWQGRLKTHVDENDLKRLRYREQIGAAR